MIRGGGYLSGYCLALRCYVGRTRHLLTYYTYLATPAIQILPFDTAL